MVRVQYDGVAKATSTLEYRQDGKDIVRSPEYAFQNVASWWVNADTGGAHRVWFEWNHPQQVEIAKIGFSNVAPHGRKRAVKKFEVVGSIDCVDWQVLLKVEDAGFVGEGEFRSWVIPRQSREMCSCVGLKLYSMLGNGPYFAIRNVVMWTELLY